jgi:hypothetical protein
MENEIKAMLKLVVHAEKESVKVQKQLEQERETIKHIKMANDERISKIQEESRNLDSKLAIKEAKFHKKQEEIQNRIHEAKMTFLKRIYLCNLKSELAKAEPPQIPENTLSTIYKGKFCTVYDIITVGSKPVNSFEYRIAINLVEKPIGDLLKSLWPKYGEIWWGYRDETSTFFERDLSSKEAAQKYGERNRERLTKNLIEGIKELETEIANAEKNFNVVFDFRLITDPVIHSSYSRDRDTLKIIKAQKHKLVVSPVLTNYERTVEKIQPYKITIKQKDREIRIRNHRFTGQAMTIRSLLNGYFKTTFKAIEADTNKEVPQRNYY